MAKIRVFTLFVLGLAFSLSAAGSNSVRDCVQQTYTSQLDVREATGRNDGKQVEIYLQSVKAPKGSAWCAAFVSWCLNNCHAKAVKSAWSPSWFPASKIIWKQGKGQLPQTGDVMGIYFSSYKRIAHVGFVDEWTDKYAITVEGNTNQAGSREGDGVYRKRRLTRQIYAVANWIN